jgi:hypothetical protein
MQLFDLVTVLMNDFDGPLRQFVVTYVQFVNSVHLILILRTAMVHVHKHTFQPIIRYFVINQVQDPDFWWEKLRQLNQDHIVDLCAVQL